MQEPTKTMAKPLTAYINPAVAAVPALHRAAWKVSDWLSDQDGGYAIQCDAAHGILPEHGVDRKGKGNQGTVHIPEPHIPWDRPTDRLDRWLPMPFFNLLVGQRALTPALVATPIYTPSYIPIPMQTRREP